MSNVANNTKLKPLVFKSHASATKWVRANAVGMVSVRIQTKLDAMAWVKSYWSVLPSGGFRKA